MLSSLQRQSCLVGLDIRSSSVRLLEIDNKDARIVVKQGACESLPTGAVCDGEIRDVPCVSLAIQRISAKTYQKITGAALAVSGASVLSKPMTVDAGLDESEMEAAVWFEAKKHFPDLIDDISLDFHCLGKNFEDATLWNVHYVACRKEQVERLVAVASSAHFAAKVIDVDYYALQRALKLIEHQLPLKKKEGITAIVNLDETSSISVVVRGDEIIYTRSQAFNNPMRPLEAKHYLGTAARALASVICAQVSQTLQFYTSCGHPPLEQIVLCGECAIIPELAACVEAQQQIPVVVGNPFFNADFSSEVDAELLQATAPAFMLCSGLAMRKVTHEFH